METLEQFVSEQRIAHAERTAPQTTYAPVTGSRAKEHRKRGTRYNFRYSGKKRSPLAGAISLQRLEARVGIEPTHKGFADLSLTTWVPRHGARTNDIRRWRNQALHKECSADGRKDWSGRPGSNRRHLPWQGSTLPLSYSRPASSKYSGGVRDLQ